MPSKDNTANAEIPDIDIPIWFELHRLPYNDVIVTKLQMIGKDFYVEDLKLFNPHHIEALFGGEDSIVMLRDELAWEDLGGRDQYSFKKPNPNLKNSTETNSDPASSGSTASSSIFMIQFSNFCFFLSASLSYLSLIFYDFVFVTFVEKPNLKTDGM